MPGRGWVEPTPEKTLVRGILTIETQGTVLERVMQGDPRVGPRGSPPMDAPRRGAHVVH